MRTLGLLFLSFLFVAFGLNANAQTVNQPTKLAVSADAASIKDNTGSNSNLTAKYNATDLNFSVSYRSSGTGVIRLQISDEAGKINFLDHIAADMMRTVIIPAKGWKAGTYTLTVSDNGTDQQRELVIK